MENTKKIKLNICIPNYNYGNYLDQALASLKAQTEKEFAIYIADNASTDNSLEVINNWSSSFTDYHVKVNKSNLGFAGNLDQVAGDILEGYTIMLSSDDLVYSNALETYRKFIQLTKKTHPNKEFFFGSIPVMIDGNGGEIRNILPSKKLWFETDRDADLSAKMGFGVYKVSSSEMLNRCITNFLTPVHFITSCYSHNLYHKVGGYGGGRLYNPDKWFHWKILSEADYIFLLEKSLFKYRWHQKNQAAKQKESGALKFWVDEYRNSFEPDELMLKKSGLSRSDIVNSYCLSMLKYIYFALKRGEFSHAVRLWHWANACYPKYIKKHRYYWLLASPIQIAKLFC